MDKKAFSALVAITCLAFEATPAAALDIISPQQQLIPLVPPNASVAIHGKVILVGSQGNTVPPLAQGVVYVYEKTSHRNCEIRSCWTFREKLNRPDGFGGDRFGASVTYDGDTLLVGSPALFGMQEAVFVYSLVDNHFTLRQKLMGDTCAPGCTFSNFGLSVARAGDRAAVSEAGQSIVGAAYVFRRTRAGVWLREAKLVPSNATIGDQYGISVDLTEDTAVVGADESSYAAVFGRQGQQWLEQQVLIPWDTTFGGFGRSVALKRRLALVGAYVAPDGSTSGAGAGYLFERSHGTWIPMQKLLRSDDTSNQFFGASVALGQGRSAVLGAAGIYVFQRNSAVWENTAKLVNSSKFAASSSFDIMDAHRSTLVAVTESGVWVYDLGREPS